MHERVKFIGNKMKSFDIKCTNLETVSNIDGGATCGLGGLCTTTPPRERIQQEYSGWYQLRLVTA